MLCHFGFRCSMCPIELSNRLWLHPVGLSQAPSQADTSKVEWLLTVSTRRQVDQRFARTAMGSLRLHGLGGGSPDPVAASIELLPDAPSTAGGNQQAGVELLQSGRTSSTLRVIGVRQPHHVLAESCRPATMYCT